MHVRLFIFSCACFCFIPLTIFKVIQQVVKMGSIFEMVYSIFWYLSILSLVVFPVLWKTSPWFRYKLRMTVYYLCILGAVFSFPIVVFWPKDPTNYRVVGWIFLKLASWTRVKWEVRGAEHFKKDQSCVIMCNHQSSIDLMGMMEMLPHRCVTLIKKELLYAGPFGISATLSGSVFIDRFNTKNAVEKMSNTAKHVRDNNLKLWVFPEGTRYHRKGMLPFKKGGFHLAVEAQIPVVPLVFSCYEPFYCKPERRFDTGGFVIAQVLPPISTEGMTAEDVTKLSEDTREKMLEVFEEISQEAEKRYREGDF